MKRLTLLLLLTACSAQPATETVVQQAQCEPHVDDAGPAPVADAGVVADVGVDVAIADAGTDVVAEAQVDASVDAPVEAAALIGPSVFVYGESHVDRPGFASKLFGSLTGTWATGSKGRAAHTMSELYFTAPTDLAAQNAVTNRTRRVLVVFAGTNDYYRASTPVEFVCEQWRQFTVARKGEGWSVVLLTPLRSDLANQQVAVDTRYDALRGCILADGVTWGAAAVVDVGGDSALQNPLDGVYFESPIGTHLTTAGYEYAAGLVAPAVQALYVAP